MLKIDRMIVPADLEAELRKDVVNGLTGLPKELPAKWFYDTRGSELFEEITRLEEYYPTRRERSVLVAQAEEIAKEAHATTLLELGAGSGEKTRILLDAMRATGELKTYMPIDVSGEFLLESAGRIADEYPELDVHCVAADHDRHLRLLPAAERRMIAFLGSTIGNMPPPERGRFLQSVRAIMRPGDTFLLGVDLVKAPDRLVRAYDDARQVTAEFNRNILNVINNALDADFVPARFRHLAHWDAANEWMEMRLVASARERVQIRALGLEVGFAEGEEMRTEISAKFRRPGLEAELGTAGLEVVRWWTDPDGDYALCLSRPGTR